MLSVFVLAVVLGLASAQCGQKPSAKVVGGEEATPNEWPWQLSLQTTSGFHFCGATLFSDEWVITAAHCVDGDSPGNVIVVAGEHLLYTDGGTEQRLTIDSIDIHPDYNFPDFDAAVLHLNPAASLDEYVNIACPPVLSEDYSASTCFISGWGLLEGNDPAVPEELNEVEVDVMTTVECQSEWGNTVDDGIVCIQGVGNDENNVGGCNGDSGGPISCERNGAYDVIGAASFVNGACNTNFPTGYCRLTFVWDFIEGITGLAPGN